MDDRINKLLEDMHQTKGARFAAHQRLAAINNMTNYTISFSSFLLICISIFTVMYQGVAADWYIKYLTFISVSLSVLIIILSLQEGGKNNLLRAEMMHNCAREVLAVHRELSLDRQEPINVEAYRDKYQRIIDRYPYNHEALDRKIYIFATYQNKQRKLLQNHSGAAVSDTHSLSSHGAKPTDPWAERLWSIYGMNVIYMLIPVILAAAPLSKESVWLAPQPPEVQVAPPPK
ncbi:MAG: SLATT domain-containing protein [Pseudorhizobium pelagicum]|uniref:SLATT domain-containing protein n=1 Tax=Pseudorhizobium pelagicum TaxID=1509405 RepID=UPI0034609A49